MNGAEDVIQLVEHMPKMCEAISYQKAEAGN